MTETEKSPELRPEISENESLALQTLLVATGFVTLFYIISLAIDNDVKLSTAIAYAASTYYFWNLYKGILGKPNVFKPQGESIKLVDFAAYLLAGFTVSMVTISLYHSDLVDFDFDIRIIPLLTGIVTAMITVTTIFPFASVVADLEGWCNTIFTVVIYTTAAFGFWYLIKAVRGVSKAFKPLGNPSLLRSFTINLLVAIIALSMARMSNEIRKVVISQILSHFSQTSSGNTYIYEMPIPESEKRRYGLN